jgi:hypothetical protein
MQCACAVLSPVACPTPKYFSALSHKRQDFLKKKINEHKKRVLISSTTFVWNISHCKKNSAGYYNNVHISPCKVPIVIVRLLGNLNFLNRFSKNIQIPNLVKIRPVGAELFHVSGRTDGRVVTFRNLGNAPKNTSR